MILSVSRAIARWLRTRRGMAIGSIALVSILIGIRLMPLPLSKQTPTATNGVTSQPIAEQKPNYRTLIPTGKSIEQLGGWKRVSPPESNPVFAYADRINSVQISVSQQPLPEDFSTNPDLELKDLALGFDAKERVVASDATVFFLGTSAKGPQSVIATKLNILILMKSSAPLTNQQWSDYIGSLK